MHRSICAHATTNFATKVASAPNREEILCTFSFVVSWRPQALGITFRSKGDLLSSPSLFRGRPLIRGPPFLGCPLKPPFYRFNKMSVPQCYDSWLRGLLFSDRARVVAVCNTLGPDQHRTSILTLQHWDKGNRSAI